MFVDIIVLVILLASALIAFLRGFIREILTIFGIGGGLVGSYYGGPILIPTMRGWMGVPEKISEDQKVQKFFDIIPADIASDALAYATVFIVIVVVLSVISHFLAEFVKLLGLGPIDRALGVIFGLARGVLLVGLIYLPFTVYGTEEDHKVWLEGSKTGVYVRATSSWMAGMLPEEVTKGAKDAAQAVEEGNSTREKLQELDLLGNSNNETSDTSKKPLKNTDTKNSDKNSDGYSEEFRNNMNELIENQSREQKKPLNE